MRAEQRDGEEAGDAAGRGVSSAARLGLPEGTSSAAPRDPATDLAAQWSNCPPHVSAATAGPRGHPPQLRRPTGGDRHQRPARRRRVPRSDGGEFDVASALVEESDAITEATGHSPLKYSSLLLLAWRGTDVQASARIQANVRDATAWGEGRAIGLGDYFSAVLYNGLGRYQDALAGAERACEHDDLGVFGFALVELVEAGARGDAPEVAAGTWARCSPSSTSTRATSSAARWPAPEGRLRHLEVDPWHRWLARDGWKDR